MNRIIGLVTIIASMFIAVNYDLIEVFVIGLTMGLLTLFADGFVKED